MTTKKFNQDTVLTHAGNKPHEHRGVINPPVYRASTILFPTVEELNSAGRRRFDDYTYGLYGTPTTRALDASASLPRGSELL